MRKRPSLEHRLRNHLDRETLLKKLRSETFQRVTISFYKYVPIKQPKLLRNTLFLEWEPLGVLGRIYIAEEGINAQLSVPEHNFETFVQKLYAYPDFEGVRLNTAVEHNESFLKLAIKVKRQIVADNLPAGSYDMQNVGNHLNAEAFHQAMENENAIVVDMRNHYESRIGRFEGAICPDADTFSDELRMVEEQLKAQKDKKILLYCTGGIRCEKASAYLKTQGFEDVNQLEGGIIKYARDVQAKGHISRFKGKNFVFDERRMEKITDDVLTHCDQCGTASDRVTNCENLMCNLLFIQCENCAKKMQGCCHKNCQEVIKLPEVEQKEIRKKQGETTPEIYKKRLRPRLAEFIS